MLYLVGVNGVSNSLIFDNLINLLALFYLFFGFFSWSGAVLFLIGDISSVFDFIISNSISGC